LVLHPVKAFTNLHYLYEAVALNKIFYEKNNSNANAFADSAKHYYINDSLISLEYNQLHTGKWNHMMDQTHIGYTYWQQPPRQKMPEVKYLPADSTVKSQTISYNSVGNGQSPAPMTADYPSAKNMIPKISRGNLFYELNGCVSIEADHFTKAINSNGITWKVLPDLGKTGSAVTAFPVKATEQKPGINSPHLEYEVYVNDTGSIKLNAYFSPTLNVFSNETGLQYAISIDDEKPQLISINSDDNNTRTWGNWVSDNIIIKSTNHTVSRAGKHTIKFWMVDPCVVLQKIVLDFGGTKQSYLGPPETKANNKNK